MYSRFRASLTQRTAYGALGIESLYTTVPYFFHHSIYTVYIRVSAQLVLSTCICLRDRGKDDTKVADGTAVAVLLLDLLGKGQRCGVAFPIWDGQGSRIPDIRLQNKRTSRHGDCAE